MTENSNRNPLVSVIMPVYNCARYVDEAIVSMVNQTYKNMEIFIIDDCSTDGTKEKVATWAKLDERIKPIYKSVNTGYVESLNMAIGLSNGEYIARMDGDDISLPERIEKQVGYMASHLEVGVLGGGYKFLGTNKALIPIVEHDKIKIGLLKESQLAHPTVMFRASMLKNLDRLYKIDFLPCEDYEFWVYLSSKTILQNLEDILLEYRVHSENTSRNHHRNAELLKEITKIQLKAVGLNNKEIDYVNLNIKLWNNTTYKNPVELLKTYKILIKLIRNNRILNVYRIELFEFLIYWVFQNSDSHNSILKYLTKLYFKSFCVNKFAKTGHNVSDLNYSIIRI